VNPNSRALFMLKPGPKGFIQASSETRQSSERSIESHIDTGMGGWSLYSEGQDSGAR
jgi:hypothetical protein